MERYIRKDYVVTELTTIAHPLRVGVQFHPQHTSYSSFAGAVHRVEDLGVDTIWNWDHFFPLSGNPQGNHFEGWTLLSAMATLTQRAEIGCLVTCNTYRNAALLSDMAKTVDHISNGRLILGIGAGWFERDYKEFGYDFGTAGSRLANLERSIEIIRHRWEVDFPSPVRNPIPILIGGGGEKKTLRIAARYANITHTFGDPETFAHKMRALDNWCAEINRDSREIERSCATQKFAAAAQRDALVKAGATHLIMGMDEPWDFAAVEELVRWRDKRAH
jgi:probable F420-dependent oxidoreductase